MQYDTLMTAREEHQQRVDRLSQSYADAQADSKWLQMVFANGVERISDLFGAFGTQRQQRSSQPYERSPELAPVVLDDRRGGSW